MVRLPMADKWLHLIPHANEKSVYSCVNDRIFPDFEVINLDNRFLI